MEEEVKYTSEFDGQTTDEVLKHAKSVKDLTIPSLSNISGFVCIDNEGKAIGMMSKEQVAQVVGGLIGEATTTKGGLMSALDKQYKGANNYNILPSNKYLRLFALKQDYKHGIFELNVARAPSWGGGIPTKILISANTDNTTDLGILCTFVHGNNADIKFFKDNGFLYIKNIYTYGLIVTYTIDGSVTPSIAIVDSLSDSAEEVGAV